MLKLRRGVVRSLAPLEVEVEGKLRRAWADESLVGPVEVGDELVVNTAAVDLGLGSGGLDIVHVNLTRGLSAGDPPPGVHVMKLNYTSLQHAVDPVEEGVDAPRRPERQIPVAIISLHGQLAPLAWAARGRGRVGFIQGAGGALPASMSRDVERLLGDGLLCGHLTAGPSYGSEEAISLIGALHAAAGSLGWDAAIVGPGPGILGSESRYGHGGMAALDACHATSALGLEPIVAPRLSSGDPRPRHRGLSHHTESVLALCLRGVDVCLPEGFERLWPADASQGPAAARELILAGGHRLVEAAADLDQYSDSGLPTRTMGRELREDRLFFASPLATGAHLTSRVVPLS